ncbi:hypothetical protein MKW94_007868 [Papaver nudicaule]|uniref:J domain-containing protein n=1 Tax=Papaver nudicaule TaxID=74823 RepID=A0AA41RM24_PAPNU|nr:hypothetical protein [Papaver nudicaule]
MECNKDEAIRAKELAEKKMSSKDFAGARKMIIKAQKLYPSLENITQMLCVCEVHCSAECRVQGLDPDWYTILQIEQTADDLSIKKQYRKLALLLHPDKNKFPGAEAAFKLISEAQNLLNDRIARQTYDWRRMTMRAEPSCQQNQSQPQPIRNNYPSKQPGIYSNPASTSTAAHSASTNPQQQKQHQTQPMFANGQQTFWTACPFCSSRCQAYRDKIQKAIRCQKCQQPFIAFELHNQGMPSVANNPSSSKKTEGLSQNGQMAQENIQGNHGRAVPVSQPPTKTGRASVVAGAPKPKVKEDVNVRSDAGAPKPKAKEDMNVCSDAGAEGKGISTEHKLSGTKNRKRGRNSELEEFSVRCNTGSGSNMKGVDHEARQNSGMNSGRATRSTSRQNHDVSYKENVSDDNDIASRSRRKTTRINERGEKVEKSESRVPLEESAPGRKAENCKKNGEEVSADIDNNEEPVDVDVPDPDFYDFDRDRSEDCFAVDQMWAIFDDVDGMPRFYARIKKVYSPFKVDITWLDFAARGVDETAWRRSRLPVACGKFKHEKTDTIEDICIFSHRIVWEKGVRNSYTIYPRKGETWAVYKNWNVKWSSDPNNHREFEYEYVVVLSDFTQESGISVARLVKLKGFVCLFMPTKSTGMTSFQIPSNEVLRFSHRVPSFRTSGKERKDVPGGYFELDPASLPSNLEEVSDCIDVKADGKIVLEEKPRMSKKRKNPDEKSTLNASSAGRTRSSSRMSNGYNKNANEENIGKSVPKSFSASDGVTAKTERVSEQSSSLSTDSCVIPESAFYFFEVDKTQEKFQAGQVWALYCELDGLPKYYAQIKKVVSTPKFKLHIKWLEACTPPMGVLQWHDKKMPICCGVFSSGDNAEFNSTDTFSHLLKEAAAVKGYKYEIYPRKGEVWAIYRNFSSEWSSSDLQTCQYDICKVAKADGAMKVLILEKVSGYETVFKGQRISGSEFIVEIPHHQLLRFSHQIPAIQLTDEKQGTLRGCWELDPKAMPVCFFNSK